MIPHALIVGAQKSGTTTLEYLLKHHPELQTHNAGCELGWFSSEGWMPDSMFEIIGKEAYKMFFNGNKLAFEKSANYFHFPAAPERIYKVNPKTKIIILLRNPIDRAYSHYWHEVNHLKVETLSFEDAIKRKVETTDDLFHFNYLGTGEYVTHITRWLGYFPNSIYTVEASEFFKNMDHVFIEIQRFLELKEIIVVNGHLKLRKQKYPKMKEFTRKFLQEYYNDYNNELYKMLGANLNWQ